MKYSIYLIIEEEEGKYETLITQTKSEKLALKARLIAKRCINSYWECRYNECEYGYELLWSTENEEPLKEIPEG